MPAWAAGVAGPSTYTLLEPVVKYDLNKARARALGEALSRAGLADRFPPGAINHLLGGGADDLAVVKALYGLKQFSIDREEKGDGTLSVVMTVQPGDDDKAACLAGPALPNLGLGWLGFDADSELAPDSREVGRTYGEALRRKLSTALPGRLLDAGSAAGEVYLLSASLHREAARGWFHRGGSRLDLRLMAGHAVLAAHHLEAGGKNLLTEVAEDLGYANLRKTALTEDAREGLEEAARLVAEDLRCAPAVLRLPEPGADGGFVLHLDAAAGLARNRVFFHAATWPFGSDGRLDPSALRGTLKLEWSDASTLRFSAPAAGRPAPVPGGYLIIF